MKKILEFFKQDYVVFGILTFCVLGIFTAVLMYVFFLEPPYNAVKWVILGVLNALLAFFGVLLMLNIFSCKK